MFIKALKCFITVNYILSILIAIGSFPSVGLCQRNADQPIRHSFFIAGPNFTGVIDEEGDPIWDSGRPAARDGFVFANGEILICWSDVAILFDKDKQEVFRYQVDSANHELGTIERLENDLFLVAELGQNPRLIEINKKGEIKKEIILLPETHNIHMQTRMARKLINGNYLVPHLLAFAVKEYDPNGKVVRTIHTDLEELGGKEAENWPFTAIRLVNGNTLINLTHGNKTIEVDSLGDVVWQVSNDDFDQNPFNDACGAQRLSNGNTVIAAYNATSGIKLFEVSPEKELIWKYTGPFRIHHFQILTTNGIREGYPVYK